jgi:DNA-binding NtrC family response regulator
VVADRREHTLLLLSNDGALERLVRGNISPQWKVERRNNFHAGEIFKQPHVGLVVLDDAMVVEGERGWLLGQIRQWVPGVPIMYVADNHDLDNEKRARANGAQYYTSKPLDEHRFALVLQSFLKMHK